MASWIRQCFFSVASKAQAITGKLDKVDCNKIKSFVGQRTV